MKDYQKRAPEEYNTFRTIIQWIACNVIYGPYFRFVSNLKVEGRENVPKDGMLIVASNHVSAIDPFIVIHAVRRPAAYMAKVELFEKWIMRLFLDLLGAFAVDRTKLSVSTIKTVLGLKKTKWCLGIFPQGTRERDDNMEHINKGFASFAKTLKCDILPVAILGASKNDRKLTKRNMKVKIGKPIPYNNNIDEMIKVWSKKITDMLEGKEDECKES